MTETQTTAERADAWLADFFRRYPEGARKSVAIEDAARQGVSRRAAERAARKLGVVTALDGPRSGFWRMPA